MGNENSFTYSYSSLRQEPDDQIRRHLLPENEEVTAEMRQVQDRKKKRAMRQAVLLGILFLLMMGGGLSLVLVDVSTVHLIPGLLLGLCGIAGMLLMPMVYQRILLQRRNPVKINCSDSNVSDAKEENL